MHRLVSLKTISFVFPNFCTCVKDIPNKLDMPKLGSLLIIGSLMFIVLFISCC